MLFSLAIGLVALLAVSERMPRWLGSDAVIETPSRRAVLKQVARSKALPVAPESHEQGTVSHKEHGRIYKWRDARGGIHIATEPPPENVQATIIPFVRARPAKPAAVATNATKSSTKSSSKLMPGVPQSPSALLSVYTPEGFENLLDRVEETALKLRERSSQLEALEKQL